MPIYEYECQECSKRSEIMQKMDEKAPAECPQCGAEKSLTRVISASTFRLKGAGWFRDGYGNKPKS